MPVPYRLLLGSGYGRGSRVGGEVDLAPIGQSKAQVLDCQLQEPAVVLRRSLQVCLLLSELYELQVRRNFHQGWQ